MAPIVGRGSVRCTNTLSLSHVLHIPKLLVNLLSVSSINKSHNCRSWFDPTWCGFQELKTGEFWGLGPSMMGCIILMKEEKKLPLHPVRLQSKNSCSIIAGFDISLLLLYIISTIPCLSYHIYPSLFKLCTRESVVCDVCELAKHTRCSYPSIGLRSSKPFEIIPSDVWEPCEVHSIFGHHWFVTFIDYFRRFTWLYLLKNKSDILSIFKDRYALIKNQHATTVKILRSDNGTEYINQDFYQFLTRNGIEHQTTCVNTPEQNGVAERKYRYLLEVVRSLMFTMHVPKFWWREAIKIVTYSINCMPLHVLSYGTPAECLLGSNNFIVPPKFFGCVCFVHDYGNSVGKLDPRALKCVFTGYSPSKKGYRCWCPFECRFFESLDVTFHEYESYYGPSCNNGVALLPLEGQ
jgi:hypothetical protein